MSLRYVYNQLNKTAFYICLIFAIGLLIASFIVPPVGTISPSVLTGVGELFAFATLGTIIEAINRGVDAKLVHNNTEINLTNPDNNKKSGTV